MIVIENTVYSRISQFKDLLQPIFFLTIDCSRRSRVISCISSGARTGDHVRGLLAMAIHAQGLQIGFSVSVLTPFL